MDCSSSGFLVHHQLPEPTQTHDAIQPSHPLLSPSLPAFNISQHQVFSNESVLHIRWPKYWTFSFSISPSNEYSGLISFRIDWLDISIFTMYMIYFQQLSNIQYGIIKYDHSVVHLQGLFISQLESLTFLVKLSLTSFTLLISSSLPTMSGSLFSDISRQSYWFI